MIYSLEVDVFMFDTSVGVKEYVEAPTIQLLEKRGIALVKSKVRELKQHNKDIKRR